MHEKHGGMCGLAETCRTRVTEVVSSSPATAGKPVVNLGKSLHLAYFIEQSDIWYAVGGILNLSADKLLRGKLKA